MNPRTTNPGAGISRGMWLALIATLILVAASYGVRQWRESRSAAVAPVEATTPTAVSATAIAATPSAPTAPAVAASEPALAPATPATSTVPAAPAAAAAPMALPAGAANATPSAPPPPGLRPVLPGATNDAMSSRNPPPPPSAAANEPAPPPPPPPPPPPSFRLIGRYAESPNPVAFFAHENNVIAAKPGSQLPGGFTLKTIRADGVTVVRQSNKEKIEMNLETPK